MPTYILCPGQGAQAAGMGKDFYDKFDESRRIFDRANAVMGFDLKSICFNGPETEINKTNISQPAIYVTSIASYAAAEAAGRLPKDDVAYAGLSLGEYTALHLAGAFDFETGLKLVKARGELMQRAAEANPSTMVAVMGGDEKQVTELCEQAGENDVLVPANFNAPGQIVVSGTKPACKRFIELANTAGLKFIELPVAGAFHSPLMESAAVIMKSELDRASIQMPKSKVFSNVTAQLHTDVASIKKLLVDQIVKPVRWEQTMAQVANVEGNKFIELSPGKVLTGLLRKQNRRAEVLTLSTVDALTV